MGRVAPQRILNVHRPWDGGTGREDQGPRPPARRQPIWWDSASGAWDGVRSPTKVERVGFAFRYHGQVASVNGTGSLIWANSCKLVKFVSFRSALHELHE